jgi:hypothetical protein
VDVVLTVIGMIGAVVAFIHTLRTWREGQYWKRAEQLDQFIDCFERDELLKLARTALDWTFRKTEFKGKELSIRNDDVLLAVRLHNGEELTPVFTSDQALLRDSYDALIEFLGRLDVALESRLIDRKPAKQYFAYWLELLITMDLHPDKARVLNGQTPAQAVAGYMGKYGDPRAIKRLCSAFDLNWAGPSE